MVKAKQGEITSPLLTAVLAARIGRYLKTERMFPGMGRKPDFTDHEWNVVEQALRFSTKALEDGR